MRDQEGSSEKTDRVQIAKKRRGRWCESGRKDVRDDPHSALTRKRRGLSRPQAEETLRKLVFDLD